MARKRGEYQKRKKHQELVKDVFSILTVVFVALVLILLIINDSIAIKQIQRGTLKEYTGAYSSELKRTYGKNRHWYYHITLDNGDSLYLPKSQCENPKLIEEQQAITFHYSKNVRGRLFCSAYRVLSAETVDEDVALLDLNTTTSACVRRIWLMSILLAIWCIIFGGLFLL